MRDILATMDDLLVSVEEAGREPQHWLIRQSDWLEIGRRFRDGDVPDPSAIGAASYREVPVHYSDLEPPAVVGIVDRAGDQTIIA